MTSQDLMTATRELTRIGGPLDLGRDPARLLVRMLHLLARGGPASRVQVDRAIAELGVDENAARRFLDAWTERTNDSDIVGMGLTHNPTPHQVTVDGARMWTWCAEDTLIFAIVLNRPITVESTAPGSAETVRLRVSPDGIAGASPAGAVITWPAVAADAVDLSSTSAIWGTFCHHSFLFPSREAAEKWAADRDNIAVLSLEDGFAVAREVAAALLRYQP